MYIFTVEFDRLQHLKNQFKIRPLFRYKMKTLFKTKINCHDNINTNAQILRFFQMYIFNFEFDNQFKIGPLFLYKMKKTPQNAK